MTCNYISIPKTGTVAIVCGKLRKAKCVKCGRPKAERECDWKLEGGKTCDALLCVDCTFSPAADKDLCPTHAKEWEEWKKVHTKKRGPT